MYESYIEARDSPLRDVKRRISISYSWIALGISLVVIGHSCIFMYEAYIEARDCPLREVGDYCIDKHMACGVLSLLKE